jgi:hypothetical protein
VTLPLRWNFPLRLSSRDIPRVVKIEAYTRGLCYVLAMARVVGENAPEQVQPRDVVAAVVLIDYFKEMARRVYAALHNPLDGLAEDLARFLELQGSEWSGEPSELHSQLKSHHKPNRVNEFGKMVRAAVKRQRGLPLMMVTNGLSSRTAVHQPAA